MATLNTSKKKFSSFTKKQAFKELNLTDLLPWQIPAQPVPLSDFFQERLTRLKKHFDLESNEKSKELLIDAICDEALLGFERLKFWKSAKLETDTITGEADYLLAQSKRYLEAPFLCIIEAKKDDFEQGLAQCLIQMLACAWSNQQIERDMDVFGVVSNGEVWKFYKLTRPPQVYESLAYSEINLGVIIGVLRVIFEECDRYL